MTIKELLETTPVQPGLTPTLNTGLPSTFGTQGTSANLATQTPTSNYTSLTNTGNNTNPQANPQAQQNATNQKPVNNPAMAQKLAKGGKIQLPTGTNKKLTQFNISNVDANKNVTLQDPKNPTQPGQVYSADQLASLMNGNI